MASVSLLMVPYWLSEDLRRKKLVLSMVLSEVHMKSHVKAKGFS